MEILIVIGLIVLFNVLRAVFSSDGKPSGANMGPFEIRFSDTTLNDDGTGPLVKEIQGRGLLPIRKATNIGFVTSVFDETSGEFEPVISAIDTFQEPDSVVYQHAITAGRIEALHGFVNWIRIGVVIPDILEPPYSGDRKMVAAIRIVDLDIYTGVMHGFHNDDTPGIIWTSRLDFTHHFNDKGYLEAAEHREEAVSVALKIGMAVAMADGSLDDTEGNVLKEWVVKAIAPFSGEKKEHLKSVYNNAIRESYELASNGDLSLSELTRRLNEIGEKTSKYEAVELCFEVMAADGVADVNEISTIRKVAEALDLDMDEVEKMRDQRIVGLNTNAGGHASIEDILGIDGDWSPEEIKRHLRAEFQKWNNRLNTLDEGDERDNAQLMLDRIAEARKKYA